MTEIKSAAFIGLGVMGGPMAGHLVKRAGLTVTVYNRTPAKAEAWVSEYGGRAAPTPREAARDADMVCLCVGNDDDLRGVMLGPDGVLAGAKEKAIIVDHTTASAAVAREMAKAALNKKAIFLDAPVSGGQSGAINGQLTVMAGGDMEAFKLIEPVLRKAYAKEIRLIGPAGSGQMTKMVNQVCIAGIVQGLAEALAFGIKAGLDMEQVLAVIGKGGAQSWQMDNRGKTMVEGKFDFGFAVKWMIKDLNIVMDEAARNGADVTNTRTILDYYRELESRGDCGLDTSALIRRLNG
jgi:3-hydroxyisobutyrate dehydrogenase